jgi:DNA-directed RNA polymerase specialized sigma24 family protein
MELDVLYQEAAKPLYNLALFAVGERSLAEEAALGAISVTYRHLPDASDRQAFRSESLRLLYLYGKKLCRKNLLPRKAGGMEDVLPADGTRRLGCLLEGLSYDEKFILLLFCCQKLTVPEIAETLRQPVFLVEKRLKKAAAKAG